MTKRQFDAANRWNHGCKMASDTRDGYRETMCRPMLGSGVTGSTVCRDRLAERAYWRRNNPGRPVLGISSRYRAAALWKLTGRTLAVLPPGKSVDGRCASLAR